MTNQAIVEAIKTLANELRVPIKSLFQYYTKYAIVAGWTNLIMGCIVVVLLGLVLIVYTARAKVYGGGRFEAFVILIFSVVLIGALALIVGTYVPWIYAPKASAINIIITHLVTRP